MLANVLRGGLKQIGHMPLRKPDSFVLQPHINFYSTILGSVDKELPLGGTLASGKSLILSPSST